MNLCLTCKTTTRSIWGLTCTVASSAVQLVTIVALTSKQARDIQAAAIDTDIREGTFVYVCGRNRERKKKKKRREEGGEAQLWRIRGSWDHGGKLAASKRKWRPLTSTKEWQFRDRKKWPDRSGGIPVRCECSSQGNEILLFHIIRHCTSHYCLLLPEWRHAGVDGLLQGVWQWGWPAHSFETWNIPSLSPPVNVLHTGTDFIYDLTRVLITYENITGFSPFHTALCGKKTKQKPFLVQRSL